MRKLFSLIAAMLFAGSMMAAEVTILPSDFTPVETSDYSTVKSGVTVAVTASTVTADQMRIFKNQTITISAESNISKIVFTCTANGTAKYGPGCFAAQDGYTFEADGKTGTWVGEAKSVAFTAESNQVRATSIVVTLDGEEEEPDEIVIYDWRGKIGSTILGGNSNITTGTVKIHKNVDEMPAIVFGSSYVYAEGKYIAIKPAEGGFKAGDVLYVAAVFSDNNDSTKYAQVDLRAADGDTRIWLSDSASTIDVKTSAAEPIVQTYKLEADQDSLLLGRYGNTKMYILTIMVGREGGETPIEPLTKPEKAPAAPKQAVKDVIAIYCNHYTNNNADFQISGWAGGYETLDLQGTKAAFWTGMTWECIIDTANIESAHDFSAYENVHIDIWAPLPAKVKISAESYPAGYKDGNKVDLAQGWNSFDFALAEWPEGFDFSNMKCFTIDQYQTPEGESFEHNPFAIANVYFWNKATAEVDTLPCVIAAEDALAGQTYETYVKGYVTEIAYAWNAESKNLSFWMADEKGGSNVIEAYKCAVENEADVPAVGDLVVAHGNLTKYKSTPELGEGCTVEIIEKAPVVEPKNLGEKTIAEFLELKNKIDTCILTGTVKNIVMDSQDPTKPNIYGNFDLEDATASVFIYGLLTPEGEAKKFPEMGIVEGDIITIKAIYYEYNSAPQVKNAILVRKKGQGIDNTGVETKVEKFFRNGQLIIRKNGVEYNAQGARVL